MADLPQELIIEILLRLPVKSLLRFRYVSKSLCSVIDRPHFTNSHLCKSSQNFNLRTLVCSDLYGNRFYVCDVNLDLEEEILHLGKPVPSLHGNVCGSCNGLLLLKRSKLSYALWNPSTRQYRVLPDFPAVRCCLILWSGLGYDESTNDYKVLLMTSVLHQNSTIEIQVWIYGLKSNIWGRTHNFPYLAEDNFAYDYEAVGSFADGSLHWMCTFFTLREEIVAFDLKKEAFSLVPQPVIFSINPEVIINSRLHVLEGSLCITCFHQSCDLYIRKKDGVDRFSWTMLFCITKSLSSDISTLKVLGYSKRGHKLLLGFGFACMVSFDVNEKTFRKVDIDNDTNWDTPYLCLESLVSVAGGA